MKNPPDEIYLQWHGDAEPGLELRDVHEPEVTWSNSREFDGDVRYVRSEVVDRHLAAIERAERFSEALRYIDKFDRSPTPEYGEAVNGEKPPVGARWLTPREKAAAVLSVT